MTSSILEKEEEKKSGDEDNNESRTAVASTELEEVVFILQKDGTVKKLLVKTGIQDISNIEILEGLKEGDEVITAPYTAINEKLKDGMKVEVAPKEKLFEK